ncbi:thioredoxin-disulfide reductase [Clostridium chauvoei]|uniref:Thioredoxin reductase n=2 Tax=Clostridium chauvoei TaxID=46867 RepID=S6EUQ9_9CLOT|nr:thioredoxin-disulfide reductase [Clostridium chauvoei]ATD53905.1 thioredoxin-disulfide reductase [Clostridium chauvoei]ATD58290.1 thioredoxin-disulfide reductase [Clostridium chauvoei]MBX7280549.1 thioredoxin-disulfide reductase [Clostridium chauvoei]MBX7283123.1 thioredoxin-disulfide reductase [Clostridium chauvoei]MBX7285347.1 thioredoxin-disulfide reductase [Clostridium chauvoei]
MDKEIKFKELIIIGGGPAGLTSAIYATRAKIDMLLLEDKILGGQVRNSYTIENYPGFKKISGTELSDLMQQQAEELGAEIDEFDVIEKVDFSEDEKIIETGDYIYKTKAVIIATGASPKKLPISNESKFAGKGIHYCAVCDGAMYQDKIVAVVGGGNSALEEAIFLTKFAKKVIMIRRHNYFNGEKAIIDEVENNPKIEIMYNYDLVDAYGEDFLQKVKIKNTKNKETKELDIDAIFGFIGTEPKTDMFKEYIKTTSNGYIITDENMKTNVSGVYAAGDVRDKQFRQITTAVADGTIAALSTEKYIVEKRKGL